MRRNKLVLILIFLALLAAAVYLLSTHKNKETLKPIFTADSTAVAGIEIKNKDGSVILGKVNGRWSVTKPISWSVQEDRMSLLFQQVILEKYSTLPIASGKQALKDYGFESDGVLRIKAFDAKGKLLREAWFSNPGNPFDYFRFAGSDKVYQIRQKVATVYTPGLDSWRSPFVLSLWWDQMLSIKVKHPKNSYELTRNGDVWRYKDKNEDFDIPAGNLTMGKILNSLSQLGSYSFLSGADRPPVDSLGEPVLEVTILQTDKQTRKIAFYAYKDKYLMIADNHPEYDFEVLFDTVFRFTRHAPLFRAREGYPPR